jgi:hypothetical protein
MLKYPWTSNKQPTNILGTLKELESVRILLRQRQKDILCKWKWDSTEIQFEIKCSEEGVLIKIRCSSTQFTMLTDRTVKRLLETV